MRQKLEFRGKPFAGIADAIGNKEARLKALRLGRLDVSDDDVAGIRRGFRAVQRTLRQADLP
jgi:hypothetical protein